MFNVLIFSLLFLLSCAPAHAQYQTPAQLMQTVQASLVEVRAESTRSFQESNGQTRVGTYHSQGSGVIIDSSGIIVTNAHIVANTTRILVGLSDGQILQARVVYSSDADLCLLKVDPPYPLTAINWADSSQAVVGTAVLALSYTDDDHQRIEGGAITGLINNISSNNIDLFELNLDLHHGDSGGPLLDDQGNLLGLIMARKTKEDDKSYAITSSKIQQDLTQYRQNPSN